MRKFCLSTLLFSPSRIPRLLLAPSSASTTPHRLSPLSSAKASSHFHVAACSPRLSCAVPSYLCNGCTTGHGSRQGNVFSAKKRSPPPSKANVYAFGLSLKFSREKKKKRKEVKDHSTILSVSLPRPLLSSLYPHRSPRLRRVHDDDFVMGHACYREA